MCEGHGQILMVAVAAEEGSAKLTMKAAKAAPRGACGNPRRFLWAPQSWHLLVICAAHLLPFLKALSSRTRHGGPPCDKSACVHACSSHLVSGSCDRLHPARLPESCAEAALCTHGQREQEVYSASSGLPGRAG